MAEIVVVDVTAGTVDLRPLTAEEEARRLADADSATAQVDLRQSTDTNRQTIDDRLDQALDAMRAHVTRGTFTAAQRDVALLLVLRVCIGVVRLLRSRLEGVD